MSDRFKRFVDDLEQSLDWLRSLNLKADPTRFGHYARVYETIESIPIELSLSSNQLAIALAGLECGQELSEIREFLPHFPIDDLRRRLKVYLTGPTLEVAEKSGSSSNRARNTGFELVFAARLAKAGYTPVLPEWGDLAVRSQGNLNIECKRPQSVGSLEKAIKEASDQLTERKITSNPQPANLIVLSIGKALHGGSKILEVSTPEMVSPRLSGLTSGFILENEHLWQMSESNSAHAILAELSAIVHVVSTNYWLWAQFDVINPVEKNRTRESDLELYRLAQALDAASHLTLK